MNITLPPELASIVKAQMSSGRYGSADAVVSDALSLLQQRNRTDAEKLEDLRREIAMGLEELDRGEGVEFNEALIVEVMQSGRQRQRESRQ